MVVDNLIAEKEMIVSEMNKSMFLGHKPRHKQSEEEQEEEEREKFTITLFHSCMKKIELRNVSMLVKEGLNLDYPDEGKAKVK